MLKAVFERATEVIRQSCEIETDEKSPHRVLRTLIKQMIRSLEKDRDYRKIYLAVLLNKGLSQKIGVDLKNLSGAYYDITVELFRKMGKKNPKRWALFFDVQFKGISSGYLTDSKSFPLDDTRQMMMDMFTK